MAERTAHPGSSTYWGALCAGAIAAAFLLVGPASGSQTTVTRTAKAAEGIVQSTVSGSGNLAAVSQLNLGFKTSGTVTNIYFKQGQQVAEGQLLATLNPESAEVTLEQSRASLSRRSPTSPRRKKTTGKLNRRLKRLILRRGQRIVERNIDGPTPARRRKRSRKRAPPRAKRTSPRHAQTSAATG